MSAATPSRPILRYHGGKWRLAPWLIGLFPQHRVYVEPFGGAASVLLRKERSYAEVYNDLDGEVVNLFRVTRDSGEELRRVLSLTPFARTEYEAAWQPSDDPIEQARRTVIRAFMGFGSAAVTMARNAGGTRAGLCAGTGFRANSNRSGTTPAHDWQHFAHTGFRSSTVENRPNRKAPPQGEWSKYSDALTPIIERLRGVVIENKDALEIIAQHDGAQHDGAATLHYCDPPYPQGTRDAGSDYVHEMTDEQHRDLACLLHSVKGNVLISGYACEMYDRELYCDWQRTERASMADGARKRVEVAWMNYQPPQAGLFNSSHAGTELIVGRDPRDTTASRNYSENGELLTREPHTSGGSESL